ncbi:hypothetical protein P4S73_02890 [Paraglaciecola sp. Hal342]
MWPNALFFSAGHFFWVPLMLALGVGDAVDTLATFNGLGLFFATDRYHRWFACLPEMFWGTYKVATHGKKNECDSGARDKLYKTPLVTCGICIPIACSGFSLKTAYRDPL